MNNYLITEAYKNYRKNVFLYFSSRIEHSEDAEDLTQDVFLRLLEQPEFLQESTLCSLVFTVAHNILMDYLRRHYKWQAITSSIKETATWVTNDVESGLMKNDVCRIENQCVCKMPPLRGTIYRLTRYDEKTPVEISAMLNIPVKMVCDQLYLGRKAVRTYLKECI